MSAQHELSSLSSLDSTSEHTRPSMFWKEWLLVAGMLLAWSFLRVPIPGVNEPHYLTKAKHFWSPEWCANDFFLTSSNPHLVFYYCFGWLTQFLTLHDTAVLSRCVVYLALAGGWTSMVRGLTTTRWASVMSLSIFLLLHSLGNWSGEWLVGGVESKVPAYACLFTAIGMFLRQRIALTGLFAGLAFSFHPVVGSWGILSAAMAVVFQACCSRKEQRMLHREEFLSILAAVVLLIIAMLPGLIPAVQTLASGSPEENAKADLLQVASRLKHHLDPMTFPKADYRYFGLLIATVFGLWKFLQLKNSDSQEQDSPQINWWKCLILSTLIIAAMGVMAGWGPRPMKEMWGYAWRIKLLKLYPFRLADLMIPVALSIAIVQVLGRSHTSIKRRFLTVLVSACLYMGSIVMPGPDQNPGRLSAEVSNEWMVVCDWIRENTAADSVVYGINEQWALRWYTERADYVNYKDCPQDAIGMVEWNERLWVIHHWKRSCFVDGKVSDEELQELGQQTGMDYFITSKFGPISAAPTFQHGRFSVYRTQSE